MVPVQATFTLGNLSGTSPYNINNFDPHVAGPIGYVWPGAGQCAWDGYPNQASDNCSPGYQSPYPNGNPPGAPSNSWYQLEGDTYAPFGAVLTNSTGDLVFAMNATCTPNLWNHPLGCSVQFDPNGNGVTKSEIQSSLGLVSRWTTWIILIPPEFTIPGAMTHDASQIVSTLSNSYDRYIVTKLSPDDRYAPGWTLVAVTVDGTKDYTTSGPYYDHQFIQFTSAGEWYYVRINGVTAPSVAGRYFFKMGLYGGGNAFGVGPTLEGTDNGNGSPFVWVPPQNWPVMLVKGETDPAIITGTLRYAGYNSTLYQQPIAEAGMVWAHMTMRLDPYTGAQRPDLPTIDGQGFVNATANGHYEVEGLAPGVYDIYAEAAGYPQSLCVSGITVLKGQSLHFDCYLQPGAVIHGNVYSKHQFGDEPWPSSGDSGQYMKIELYANPTLSNIVDPSAGPPVSWSPLPCTAGGQEYYVGEFAAGLCGDPRSGSAIAFPWHEYAPNSLNTAYAEPDTPFQGTTNGYSRDVAESGVCAAGNLACTFLTSDPEGVGPPQQWYVAGGTTTPFHFEMGLKGEYGAPRDLSGEVPQVYATWINGLTPGRYYVRAWTFRYVQTALDGATFQEYYFDITPNEWAGDVTLPIDLRLSSWVNKTVYFHDTPNTIETNPIHSGAGYIWGTLTGADGHVYSANVTGLGLLENDNGVGSATGTPNYYYIYTINPCGTYDEWSYGNEFDSANGNRFQTGEVGAPSNACPGPAFSALDKSGLNANSIATGIATIQFWGINDTWGGENYGIPSGTYTPNVGVDGYVSATPPEQVSVTLSGTPTSISDHMFLAPGFNVSVYSIDWERPRVSRDWVWSGCQATTELGEYCSGSEIDIGWYPVVNGTAGALADFFGVEPTFQPPSVTHYYPSDAGGLFQGPFGIDCVSGTSPSFNCVEMDGGGRDVLPGYHYHDAYFGQSAEYAFVGGYTVGVIGFLTAGQLLTDSMFTTPILVWPLHFNEGQYNLAAYTYGYIQDKDFSAYAMNGQVADMKINLIIGVNVSLDILFKKESIITPTPYNMSTRVRLFNDQSQLVAEWMSSEGTYIDSPGHAIAANGQLPSTASGLCPGTDEAGSGCFPLYPFNQLTTIPSSGLNGYNYLPGGVTLLHVLMAGLPQQPPFPVGWEPTTTSGTYFGDPIATGLAVAKALAPTSFGGYRTGYWSGPYGSCNFQLNCYPAPYAQYPFPYTGIAGAPDYTGGWTAEVDFVPWYMNNTGTPQPLDPNQNCILPTTDIGGSALGPLSYQPDGIPTSNECGIAIDVGGSSLGPLSYQPATTVSTDPPGPPPYAQYYPPVDGLLMGESYHIIPGTTATSGISLTEDMALSSTFLGHSMAANHLGPYSQEGVWQIAGTHNSGEASAIFEVDLNGFVSGNVLAFTWSNEFRTLSWGTISVTGAPSGATWNFYTWDGVYEAFLPTGNYKLTISEPGYAPQTWSVAISPGQTGTGQNVYLEQSNIPVPEFSAAAVVAVSALAASVYLLKRRRK